MSPSPRRHKERLANGLRVVVVPLPHLHSVTVALYFRAGPRFESAKDSGLSHFLEHMLHRGTERYPSAWHLSDAVERLGSELVAETGRDLCRFALSLAPTQLAEGLALLAEIFTRPRFADIDIERQVVLEEQQEDYDEHGVETAVDDIAVGLAMGRHPLGGRILGPPQNVQRFDVGDLERHFRRCCGGRNMVLSIAGPVDPDGAIRASAAHLGDLPAGELLTGPAPALDLRRPRLRNVATSDSQTEMSLVFPAVAAGDPEQPACEALLGILDGGMSSRMHRRLYDELGLAYSCGAWTETWHDSGLFHLSADTSHNKIEALIHELLGLLDRLVREPVHADELTKVRRRFRLQAARRLDDSARLIELYGGEALYGEPLSLDARLAAIEAVDPAAIQAVARRIFQPNRMTVVLVGAVPRRTVTRLRRAISAWRPAD